MAAGQATLGDSPKRPRRKASMGRKRVPLDPRSYSGRIAARVRQLREAKGQSVDELAKALGVPRTTLYKWEQGSRDIPPDLYPKLANKLGASLQDFFPNFPGQ